MASGAPHPAHWFGSMPALSTWVRIPSRRWWIIPPLLCICFFLFTPKIAPSNCIQIIKFANAVQVPLNCDSRLLAKLYRDAGKYFTEFNNWKGRPVFFLYGVVTAPILEPVAVPLWSAIGGFASSDRKLSHYRKYFSLHLAYYSLNIGVVLFSIWLALNLLGLPRSGMLAISLSGAIASSDLVAGTIWLAHTNIFNLLAPITCAFFVCIGFQNRITRPTQLFLWAGAAGLMVLVYPLFILALPAWVAGLLLAPILNRFNPRPPLQTGSGSAALQFLVTPVLFVLPVLIWSLMVRYVFVTPVYMTAQYGQFVWMLDAYADGKLLAELVTHLSTFVSTLQIHFSWFETILPLSGAIALLVVGDRSRMRWTDPALLALLIAALGILSFNYLQGYYAARLQISVASLSYMAVARLAYLLDRPRLGTGFLSAIILAQLVDASMHYAATAE